jgi:hypothetical protein
LSQDAETGQRAHEAMQGGRVRMKRSGKLFGAALAGFEMVGEPQFRRRLNQSGDEHVAHANQCDMRGNGFSLGLRRLRHDCYLARRPIQVPGLSLRGAQRRSNPPITVWWRRLWIASLRSQ